MAIYHYHRSIGKRSGGKNAVFIVAYIRGEKRTCQRILETKDFSRKNNVIYAECILPEDAPMWAVSLRHSKIRNSDDGNNTEKHQGGIGGINGGGGRGSVDLSSRSASDGQVQFTASQMKAVGQMQSVKMQSVSDRKLVYDESGRNFSEYAWDQIEIIERRGDAQLYFHDDIAIPVELSEVAAIELIRDFVQKRLAIEGVFCDVAIHWDDINPHAHVVMPLRKLTDDGFSNKIRFAKGELSNQVKVIRAEWADFANQKLQEYGIDARIDHRSFKDMGVELIPMRKVGKATHMTGTEHQEIHIAQNQLIRAQNYQKIRQNPDVLATKVALEHIVVTDDTIKDGLAKYVIGKEVLMSIESNVGASYVGGVVGGVGISDASKEKLIRGIIEGLKSSYSVFSEKELKARVLQEAKSTNEFEEIVQGVIGSNELLHLGLGDDGRVHYATRHAFAIETELSLLTERLAKKSTFIVSDELLQRISRKYGLNEGQHVALRQIVQCGNLGLVVGVAGSGKTYLLKAAHEVWMQSGFGVQGIAFSGRAASGLEEGSGISSNTIHRFISGIAGGYRKLSYKDVVVMDEMGMTSLDDMYKVLKIVEAAGAKFVGVGDIEQTQPIGRGAPMRAMIEQVGSAFMDKIIRQQVEWQRAATFAMETSRTSEGLDAYRENGLLNFVGGVQEAKEKIVDAWYLQYRQSQNCLQQASSEILVNPNLSSLILIAHKNETVKDLNLLARAKLVAAGVIPEGSEIKIKASAISGVELGLGLESRLESELVSESRSVLRIAIGDRLLFGKNDYSLGLNNGDFGTVTNIEGNNLTVRIDRGKEIRFSTEGYDDFTYGYAATIHKLQGFTGDYSFVYVDGRTWDRHLFLVAASRHRCNLEIFADSATFKNYDDLKETISRCGLKDHVFEYPVSFALRRGFEPESVVNRAAKFIKNSVLQSLESLENSWEYLVNYQEQIESEELKEGLKEGLKGAERCDGQHDGRHNKQLSEQLRLNEQVSAQPSVQLNDPYLELNQRRRDAVIVADFCDNRAAIAGKVVFLKELSIKQPIEKNVKARIKEIKGGEIYELQLKNSILASDIVNDYQKFSLAMEKNRLTRAAIEKAIEFGRNREKLSVIVGEYQLQQFYNPILAAEIYDNICDFYGHINSFLKERKERSSFIAYVKHLATENRYNLIEERFGSEFLYKFQGEINTIKRYIDLDYEISFALRQKNDVSAVSSNEQGNGQGNEQKLARKVLHDMSIERGFLAHSVSGDEKRFSELIKYFDIDLERVSKHERQYCDRELVRKYSELFDKTSHQVKRDGILSRRLLASKIKANPKRFGIYIDDFLKGGWREINLDNWHHARRMQVLKSSNGFQKSYRLVRNYFDASYLAKGAWQAAIKRRDTSSINYKKFLLRANGLSYARDKIANILVSDMEHHAGAIAFEKINLARLVERGSRFKYFERYLAERNEMLKIRMAHHISENMKSYGNAIAVHGLYYDVKERARHYDYLRAIKCAPSEVIRDVIRLAERYRLKRNETAGAWTKVKTAKTSAASTFAAPTHLNRFDTSNSTSSLLLAEAKHITRQRNKAAYELMKCCVHHGLTGTTIEGIKIDYAVLEKASAQHIAYEEVLHYLSADKKEQLYLANELLRDKACYHFIFDLGISFEDLKSKSREYFRSVEIVDRKESRSKNKSKNKRKGKSKIKTDVKNQIINNPGTLGTDVANRLKDNHYYFNIEAINAALMANPEATYMAIFGEPKSRAASQWRYTGGLIVTMQGRDSGKWYSFTENKGGGPIKAIQERMGLAFKDALKYGVQLAGLSEREATLYELSDRNNVNDVFAIQIKANNSAQESQRSNDSQTSKNLQISVEQDREQRIKSAASIWVGTEPIVGTIAERYFVEHRKISDLDLRRMEIRYWPIGRQWIQYDDRGNEIQKTNKIPAAVIAVLDNLNNLTGVQRIYLDEKTAGKNSFMETAKLSKGITKGSAALIQRGTSERLYIVEGPETGASIGMVDRDATVLATLSVGNIANMEEIIRAYNPREVIIAADNDGYDAATRAITKSAFDNLVAALRDTPIDMKLIFPQSISEMEKVDWNDVLVKYGRDVLLGQIQQQLQKQPQEQLQKPLQPTIQTTVVNPLHYYGHNAAPIQYTPGEHYLREINGLISSDLSDVRYDESLNAILVPVVNKVGQVVAEQIIYLDKEGNRCIKTEINSRKYATDVYKNEMQSNVQSAVQSEIQPGKEFRTTEFKTIFVQKGDNYSVLYIANNFIDAKSIAIGDDKVNIFISLDNYNDLDVINSFIADLPKKPSTIALVSDNFEIETQNKLYNLSEPLRNSGYEVVAVRGRATGDYTHVSINEALRMQDKVRGDSFIERIIIKAPIKQKASLKDRIKNAINPLKEKITNSIVVSKVGKALQKGIVRGNAQRKNLKKMRDDISLDIRSETRPATQAASYYVTLEQEKLKYINDYFATLSNLLRNDTYSYAVEVAEKASVVYDILTDEIRLLNLQPQKIAPNITYNENIDPNLIHTRLKQGKAIGLQDLATLIYKIAEPKLDSKTYERLINLSMKIVNGEELDKNYGKEAKRFIHDHTALIKALQQNDRMSGSNYEPLIQNAEQILKSRPSRAVLLNVVKHLQEEERFLSKKYKLEQSINKKYGGRSRGGRSR